MYKKLIIEAFKKAKSQREEKGEKNPSNVSLAEDLSDYIDKTKNHKLGEKSFRVYKNEAEKLTDSSLDINIKQFKIVIGLCKYLGYNNYEDFSSRKSYEIKKRVNFFKKNGITLSVLGLSIIIFSIISSAKKQRWMIWEENHYAEVNFDTKKYNLGQLKLYNEERITNFKQIYPDSNTIFFDSSGDVKIWYGKNNNKELEYFTALGLHPETGKTLDPITIYMIRKYIYKD